VTVTVCMKSEVAHCTKDNVRISFVQFITAASFEGRQHGAFPFIATAHHLSFSSSSIDAIRTCAAAAPSQ
jgi:hypothetical protein